MEKPEQDSTSHDDYFEPYAYFARTVRLWFVAYGIGVPAATISNEWLLEKLQGSGCLPSVFWCFFSGVAVQVLMAMIWRTSMWYQYIAADASEVSRTRMYRASKWLSERYVFEMIPDVVTITLFAIATFKALSAACS